MARPEPPSSVRLARNRSQETNSILSIFLNKAAILAGAVLPPAGVVAAAWLAWHRIFGWRDLVLLIGLFIPISLGTTIGFHRYLTHRGFRTNTAVKVLLLILGSMAVQGSAIDWVANHRKHHALSDRAGDPHSPVEGFFHAHIGWLWNNEQASAELYARDLVGPISGHYEQAISPLGGVGTGAAVSPGRMARSALGRLCARLPNASHHLEHQFRRSYVWPAAI